MEKNEEGFIVLYEAPKIEKPEFRLYYDNKGKVVCYTCEKLEGNFIVIDAMTFAQARPDIRVVNGEITSNNPGVVVSKLMPCDHGQPCAKEDISIVVDRTYRNDLMNWRMITYEL